MRTRLLFLLIWLLAPLVSGADAPHVGIIADPSARDAADLLTAELSRQPVKLLERVEIKRVLEENRLSLTGLTAGRLPQIGAPTALAMTEAIMNHPTMRPRCPNGTQMVSR